MTGHPTSPPLPRGNLRTPHGVDPAAPLIPLQQGRPKHTQRRWTKFEASRRPHPAGLIFVCAHPHTEQEQTSPSRARSATPLLVPIRGRGPVVDNFRRAFIFAARKPPYPCARQPPRPAPGRRPEPVTPIPREHTPHPYRRPGAPTTEGVDMFEPPLKLHGVWRPKVKIGLIR